MKKIAPEGEGAAQIDFDTFLKKLSKLVFRGSPTKLDFDTFCGMDTFFKLKSSMGGGGSLGKPRFFWSLRIIIHSPYLMKSCFHTALKLLYISLLYILEVGCEPRLVEYNPPTDAQGSHIERPALQCVGL